MGACGGVAGWGTLLFMGFVFVSLRVGLWGSVVRQGVCLGFRFSVVFVRAGVDRNWCLLCLWGFMWVLICVAKVGACIGVFVFGGVLSGSFLFAGAYRIGLLFRCWGRFWNFVFVFCFVGCVGLGVFAGVRSCCNFVLFVFCLVSYFF